jgi:hypothetical protein
MARLSPRKNHPAAKPVLPALVALAVLVAVGSLAPALAGAVEIQLDPQLSSVLVADTFTIDIFVATDGDSLACVLCTLSYDHSLLTLVSVEEGSLFVNSSYPTFFRTDSIAPDRIDAVDCLMGHRLYFLSPGVLASFVFRAEQPGVARVRIEKFHLYDIDRIELFPAVDPNAWITIGDPTGSCGTPPARGKLSNFPNPFNPSTTLTLTLPQAVDHLCLDIFSVPGRRIIRLFDGPVANRELQVGWDGRDGSGHRVSSGVYLAVARANGILYHRKLVLIE